MNENQIDMVRIAGVRRGINASIATLEQLRDRTEKGSHQDVAIGICLLQLRSLTIEQAEEI